YSASKFKSTYTQILGEKMKRVDKKFADIALIEPLIYNKSYYYVSQNDSEIILTKNLENWILKCYKAAKEMNDFLKV
ncbi:MAG: DUF2461 family protein, partial [Saprospiraceae bacterium]